MADNYITDFPKFLPNKPCGVDKFEGKSQERLTNAIASHIINIDKKNNSQFLSRIIGLEGGWGIGKSNVIKQLKSLETIKDNYFLFEYDAWGHQEDLQRRSFLETLTAELIEKDILTGKTEIAIKGGGIRKVTWKEKLKFLLARKTEISTEKHPKLSPGIITFILVTIFTSIAISISSTIKDSNLTLSIILPVIPILLGAIILGMVLKKRKLKWTNILSEIFSVYNGKIENEISFETISEDEPTVTEFKKWMQDVSDHLESKKLIIVYDNMDRLPSEKVKELWSSIHTFFSEDGFKNIWAIIPFDEQHLARAFGRTEENGKLAKYFISKTFPVVYSVKPPVITDFKKIFEVLFQEAFGTTETESLSDISRIFRLEKPNASIREIIEYINQLVSLKNIWKDEIGLKYIAVFRIKKDEIFKNPIQQILSGEYLGSYISKIVSNDETLQNNISALTYGVSLKDAEQIPMSKYIDNCFNLESGSDLNKYSSSIHFFSILREKIYTSDKAQIDNIIISLSKLETSNFTENNQSTILDLWNWLARTKIKTNLSEQKLTDTHEILLKRADENYKQKIVETFCHQIQSFEEFNSENYFNSLNQLDAFLQENNIKVAITDYLNEILKTPEIFVDYVLCAKEKYSTYKLTTKSGDLSKYLINCISEKHSGLNSLKYIADDDAFQFDEIKQKIKDVVSNQSTLTVDNFDDLIKAYKVLSNEKPLDVQLNPTQRQNLWSSFSTNKEASGFLEIVTIQIASGTNINIQLNDEQVKYVSENIDYYGNYGELLINNLSWNIPLLTQVLKYMTENKLGVNLTLENVLPKFIEIKNILGITEAILLEQLNDWEEYKHSINSSNIQQVIPQPQFYQFSKETKNNLTDYLNHTVAEALSNVQANQLYQFKQQQPNNYWILVLNNLVDTEYLKSFPDNLVELGKRCLDDIAASRLSVPNESDLFHKVINRLDRRKTKETITNIRNQICNDVSGYAINAEKFLFLHDWLEKQGDLTFRAGDVTQYILTPISNDYACLNLLAQKTDFYARIINSAGEQANTFKTHIKAKLLNNENEELMTFAEKIGVEKEENE